MQAAHGGRIGFSSGGDDDFMNLVAKLREAGFSQQEAIDEAKKTLGMATGGRAGYRYGDQVGITAIPRPVMDPRGLRSLPAMATKDGMMDLGGLEKDYRFDGGFVPIGAYEKKDDVPARLSKNEFVFTADAVRAAGGGSINKGAKRMYETMKNLEAKPEAKRMTA